MNNDGKAGGRKSRRRRKKKQERGSELERGKGGRDEKGK